MSWAEEQGQIKACVGPFLQRQLLDRVLCGEKWAPPKRPGGYVPFPHAARCGRVEGLVIGA